MDTPRRTKCSSSAVTPPPSSAPAPSLSLALVGIYRSLPLPPQRHTTLHPRPSSSLPFSVLSSLSLLPSFRSFVFPVCSTLSLPFSLLSCVCFRHFFSRFSPNNLLVWLPRWWRTISYRILKPRLQWGFFVVLYAFY